MNTKEMIFQQGRLSGLKEACELTGVINTGKANYEPLLTLIRELNIKLQGTTVHDCECKQKARACLELINKEYPPYKNYNNESEYENSVYGFDLARQTIIEIFNLSEGE